MPGLVLAAEAWPSSTWLLVDSMVRRTSFLVEAVSALSLDSRVRVVTERAEVVGRDPEFRATAAAVTARGFGPPAVTAECAAPLLAVGGVLMVSEPPEAVSRWPEAGLAPLGLGAARVVEGFPRIAVLRQVAACGSGYPRRVGVPGKRPLF